MRKSIAALGIVLGLGLLAGCGQSSDEARPTVTVSATATPGGVTPGAATPGAATPGAATPDAEESGATAAPQSTAPPAPEPPAGRPVAAEEYLGTGSLAGDVVFHTPTGKIHCRLGDATTHSAGYQSTAAPVPPGAEKSCAGTENFLASVLSRGFLLYPDRVKPTCFNQGYLGAPDSKALPYNRSITANGYICTSRLEGVTCLTAAGKHGFFISMQAARSW